jgi:hypothetical protein
MGDVSINKQFTVSPAPLLIFPYCIPANCAAVVLGGNEELSDYGIFCKDARYFALLGTDRHAQTADH